MGKSNLGISTFQKNPHRRKGEEEEKQLSSLALERYMKESIWGNVLWSIQSDREAEERTKSTSRQRKENHKASKGQTLKWGCVGPQKFTSNEQHHPTLVINTKIHMTSTSATLGGTSAPALMWLEREHKFTAFLKQDISSRHTFCINPRP